MKRKLKKHKLNKIFKVYRRRKRIEKKTRKTNAKTVENHSTAIVIRERTTPTNYSNPKCYARKYSECDKEITKEHFLTKSLLEKFDSIEPDNIEYINITSPIKPINLTVNCLCKFHNNSLSTIDSYIELFFRKISSMNTKQNTCINFNGNNIEKWFGKCMLGYIASGRIIHNGKTYTTEDIHPSLLDFLYRNKPLPPEFGLYYINKIGGKIKIRKTLKLQTLFLEEKIVGILVSFSGLIFHFVLAKKNEAFKNNSEIGFAIHRPIKIIRADTKYKIKFVW